MAIRSSLHFLFNNVSSEDMGLINVNVGIGGLLEEPFFASRAINEVKIRGRDKSYFSGITNAALSFTLSFAFKDPFDTDSIRAVARWLFTDSYKPLQFSDSLDRIYFGIVEGNSSILHNGSQGYINLNIRCDSPYSYSPTFLSPVFDLSSNPVGGTIVSIDNRGDLNVNPEVYITMVGDGNAEIINLSNGGASLKYTYAITNPTVAPVMSQVANASSTLPAGTYYGRYTYTGTLGETMVSPETSFVLSAGNNLVMTIPTLAVNSTLANLYIGTTAGTGKLQGNSSTTNYIQSTVLVVGATAPTANTSTLKNLETVYTDCENEIIVSDLVPTTYRYANLSGNFLELIYGMNTLLVKGSLKLRFRYSYVYLSG